MADNRQMNVPRGQQGANKQVQQKPASYNTTRTSSATVWDADQAYTSKSPAGSASYGSQPKTKGGKKKKGLWRAIFWIALIVLIGSLATLGVIAYSYWDHQNEYHKVADIANANDLAGLALEDMTVDWDALLAINPETVGWIYIPGTIVNYPILQGDDNSKYLTYAFNGEEDFITFAGAIFLAAENARDFSDPNNIIYGHHMNDGSMFAFVNTFTEQSAFDANRTIYILTPQGNYRLETFSMVITTGSDLLAQSTFVDENDMLSYVQDKINRSVVSGGVDAATIVERGKIFSLSTCDYSIYDGRSVLFASVVESTVDADKTQEQEGQLINPEDAAAVENAAEEIQ